MIKIGTGVSDCYLIQMDRKEDARGFFQETYKQIDFHAMWLPESWPQDNFSRSNQGVLRGLHVQGKHQAKLVSCWDGEIFDVCVDLRPKSPTFKKWMAVTLSPEYKVALYVPPGCAHGFYVTKGPALVHYKISEAYDAVRDKGVKWDDEELKIDWPLGGETLISARDSNLPTLERYLSIEGNV